MLVLLACEAPANPTLEKPSALAKTPMNIPLQQVQLCMQFIHCIHAVHAVHATCTNLREMPASAALHAGVFCCQQPKNGKMLTTNQTGPEDLKTMPLQN
mmetsp:Transcript_7806/g.14972  ORF Transcript_7806/g.14972 Transcript_7806/m.14972 type:complete len:99 (-) Transcript_7806:426-722(-)